MKLKIQPNPLDLVVLFLGLLPLIIYMAAPYLADFFEFLPLTAAMFIQLLFYFCLGFPVAAFLYFWWRFQGNKNG